MNEDSGRTDLDVPALDDATPVAERDLSEELGTGRPEDIGDAPEVPSNLQSAMEAEVQRRREFARVWITVALVAILGLTVVWVLVNAARGSDIWTNTKDALQIILPVEAALLGSAISFYFASNRD